MAWSSPIWVDYIPLSALPKTQNKRPPAKPVSKKDLLAEEDFEEEEEEEDDFDDYDDEE